MARSCCACSFLVWDVQGGRRASYHGLLHLQRQTKPLAGFTFVAKQLALVTRLLTRSLPTFGLILESSLVWVSLLFFPPTSSKKLQVEAVAIRLEAIATSCPSPPPISCAGGENQTRFGRSCVASFAQSFAP